MQSKSITNNPAPVQANKDPNNKHKPKKATKVIASITGASSVGSATAYANVLYQRWENEMPVKCNRRVSILHSN